MEMMVVISLMGIVFFVVVPRFEDVVTSGDMDELARILSANIQKERENAISEQVVRSLFIDLDQRNYGTAGPPMTVEEWEMAELPSTSISESVTLLDVEWPGKVIQTQGLAQFPITEKGYVAYAALHLEDQDRQLTLVMEPFLGRVRLYEGYVSLDSE